MAVLTATGTSMYDAVGGALTQMIDWVGEVLTAILSGSLSPLLPLLALGIGISVVLFAVKCFKSFAWGT